MEQIERVENLKKAEMVKAASISSVPHRGVSLSEVGIVKAGTLPVSAQVFAAGIAQVGAIFGVDYIGKGSEPTPDVLKVRVLWEIIRKRGWSDADFSAALERFIATVRFPTWTPADFIGDVAGGTDVKVYPHSWYLEQVGSNKLNSEAIGCYRLEGIDRPVWGWRHEVGDHLPAWEPKAAPVMLAERVEERKPESGEVAAARAELLDTLKLQAKLEESQWDCARLRRELDTARERLADRSREVAQLEARVVRLEMGLAAVLATLEDDRQAARAGAIQYDAEAWTPEINRLTLLLEESEETQDADTPLEEQP